MSVGTLYTPQQIAQLASNAGPIKNILQLQNKLQMWEVQQVVQRRARQLSRYQHWITSRGGNSLVLTILVVSSRLEAFLSLIATYKYQRVTLSRRYFLELLVGRTNQTHGERQ
jgi:hypothetical protein